MSDSIRTLQRENREMRRRLGVARRVDTRVNLTLWTAGLDQTVEIRTATRLGFRVEVEIEGDAVRFVAVKRVPA